MRPARARLVLDPLYARHLTAGRRRAHIAIDVGSIRVLEPCRPGWRSAGNIGNDVVVSTWTPVIVALLGIAGTLSAALLTQRAATRAEMSRRQLADRDRWLDERLRVARSVIATAETIERELYSNCAHLTSEGTRESWLPGYTTVLLIPADGISGTIDKITRDILVDSHEMLSPKFDELSLLEAEVQLIGSEEEAALADQLVEDLMVAASNVEAFAPADHGFAAVLAAQATRKEFMAASRASLRVDTAAEANEARHARSLLPFGRRRAL